MTMHGFERSSATPDVAPSEGGSRDGKSASNALVIAGLAVADLTAEDAIGKLAADLDAGRFRRVAFLNAHCVNLVRRDDAYRSRLENFLILPDGIGVDFAARLLHGKAFTANLNGTDFVPLLLGALPRPLKVALVGAAPGIAERAAERLAGYAPQHEIIAASDGFFDRDDPSDLLERLELMRPDIVLVGMGVPLQERFIADHLDERHGRLLIGVGALFDFMAGHARRAPVAWRKARLEWAWRLAEEPKRLWQRYVLGNPLFLLEVLRDRLIMSRRREPSARFVDRR